MRLPGSNIEVTFESDCVIVRDDNTSNIIDISGMTFEDILTEVQTFAYFRNVRPARRLIRFILLRAGLPNQEEFAKTDVLDQEDMETLAEALGSVGDLTDRFFSPHHNEKPLFEQDEPEESQEVEEPLQPEVPQSERSAIWTRDEEVEIVYNFMPENIPQPSSEPESPASEIIEFDDTPVETAVPELPIFDESSSAGLNRLKILVLGEEGVGKQSILERAGFSIYESAIFGSLQTDSPLAYSRISEFQDEKIRIDAWSPEGATQARIPNEEFYSETGVIILVYSMADRSSFEKIEFWVEDAMMMYLTPIPIILVANKRDLVISPSSTPYDSVSSSDGKELQKRIQEKLSTPEFKMPVDYIETSCITEEGIDDIFKLVYKQWVDNEKLVPPIVESPV